MDITLGGASLTPYVNGFMLVLARVMGAFAMVPIPGFRAAGPSVAKAGFALAVTLALFPVWPRIVEAPGLGTMVVWLVADLAFGLAVGLAVACLADAMVLGAQVFGLQAGYSYASSIDPSSQADSTVLQVISQLTGNLLFFTLGLDHFVIRTFAASLERHPPGTFQAGAAVGEALVRLTSEIFVTGLRIALPVVALLVMVDVALALLSRINSQLQLLSLAFPVKMLLSLGVLAALAAHLPGVYGGLARRVAESVTEWAR
ncbi:MAG: flagellar biosynthetic protein FliR [Acidobacteria bacterium]|nr:flagellar biosynthetic protein FliR [Acidobacteriota bacterium]